MKDSEGEAQAMEILGGMGLARRPDSMPTSSRRSSCASSSSRGRWRRGRGFLISDEAMAGLAGNEVTRSCRSCSKLNETGITIIMIEHIMQAVMRFSQRVVCLDAGKIICEGTPASIVQNADVQKAYLGA